MIGQVEEKTGTSVLKKPLRGRNEGVEDNTKKETGQINGLERGIVGGEAKSVGAGALAMLEGKGKRAMRQQTRKEGRDLCEPAL